MLLPALLAVGLLAGCGDDDDNTAVTDLLDRAFETSIGSADLTLDIEIELDGVEELQDPIEVALTGPYETGPEGRIPSVDWDITVKAQNQSFNANLTSTGDRAFVGFQGTDYEISQETVAELNRQLEESANAEGGRDLADFGINAREWVVDAEDEGDEEVAGVETTHVSGKLDVTRVLEDLNTVVQEASKLGGDLGQQAPPALTDEQKDQIEDVVDDPGFDAYVGDDDRLRRLSADLEFEVPEDSREQAGGLEGGRVSFSIEFANVGSAQPVTVPEDARPISELTQQLQGLLGGALGAPQAGGGGTTAPPPQTDSEKQEAYEECVQTDPNDESVRAFCEVLLQ